MKRAVNNRLGLTAANDKLPKALLEPYPSGGSDGYTPDIQAMLRTYYAGSRLGRGNGAAPSRKALESWARGCCKRFVGLMAGNARTSKIMTFTSIIAGSASESSC